MTQNNKPQVKPVKPSSAKSSDMGIIIVVVIALVLIAGGLSYYFFFHKKADQKVVQTETAPQDTIPVVETQPFDSVSMPVSEESKVQEEIPVRYSNEPDIQKGFFIIVGSYKNKRNAERFAKKLSSDIETEVLHFKTADLYRVACGRYGNLHAAWNDRISIIDLPGCNEAWILENR